MECTSKRLAKKETERKTNRKICILYLSDLTIVFRILVCFMNVFIVLYCLMNAALVTAAA